MSVTREQVMSALAGQLAAAVGFATISRRVQMSQDSATISTEVAQPALFILPIGEKIEQSRGAPRKLTIDAVLLIWAKLPGGPTLGVPDSTTPGDTVLNPLIEAIEAALPREPMTGACTLGGVVSHCWIEGEVHKAVGDINPNGQCFAAVPVKILVP